MQSGTSFFNPTLFRKTLGRFWPLWAVYGLIWVYALPVRCLLGKASAADLSDYFPFMGLFLAVTFGLAAAAAAFSHLFHGRACVLMHSLPVRREGLFLTQYAAGLSGLLIPHALTFLLTLGAEASFGGVNFRAAAVWLLGQSALCFFFYSGAVFCAALTGHVLALPVFYGVLNGATIVVATLIQVLCGRFLFGFVGLDDRAWNVLLWLTPAARIASDVRWESVPGRLRGAGVLAVYAAAALVLTGAALLICRRRHAETAGDVVAMPALRPVFKYGAALCGGLCFGLLLHELFSLGGNAGLAISLLLWTAVCFFAAEMLLEKSFRVFKTAWRGCLAALLVMGAAVALIGFDATGFAARIPAAEQVKSVTLRGGHTSPFDDGSYFRDAEVTDPAAIERLTELHRQIVLHGEGTPEGEHTYLNLNLTYSLTNGRTLHRQYNVSVTPDTPLADAARAALCDPSMAAAAYALDRIDPDALESYCVENLADASGDPCLRYDGAERDADRGRRGAKLLYEAVQADFAAGTLGRRYLFDDEAERGQNTYAADLCLRWRGAVETAARQDGSSQEYQKLYDLTVTLTPQAENTLRVLRELGAVKDGQLLPYAQAYPPEKQMK